MKICFIAGANSVHSHKWVRYFANLGWEVHWISFTANTLEEIKGVHFYQVSTFFPFSFFKLKKILQQVQPDIVHAHYAGKNGFLTALTGLHPFILTAWGSDVLFAGKHLLKGSFVRYALKRSDLVTCDADHMERAILNMGIDSSKIKKIYFGVNTKHFSPGPKDTHLLEELQISDKPVVISLRSLEPVYDIETLIKAAKIVTEKHPKAVFLIAGQGSQEEDLKTLVSEYGITDNVKFIGMISQENLSRYLRSSDVYVSTSLSDAGIASSTAEAMACALPVVITNTGENGKWVQNDVGGYIVPIKNAELLAEKIRDLLGNEEKRKMFGHANRTTIENKNDYTREMKKMENLYRSLL